MRCPRCQHDEDRVLETRVIGEGASIRRRRQCLDCGHRFTTYEYVESAPIEVVKRDGRREPFQRQKIEHGLVRACEKRPIAREVIEELVDRVERELFRSGKSEIRSVEIGRRVMEALGVPADEAARDTDRFREHDEALLRQQHLVYDDEAALIASTAQARKDLENLFEADEPEREPGGGARN